MERTKIKKDKDKDGDQIETSFLQNGNKNKDKPCYCCGRVGCIPLECPKKEGLARDQWFDKTGKVLHQRGVGGATAQELGFSGLQLIEEILEEVI